MKAINMSIKKVYLDAIRSGAKKTEYRDMSDYWIGKLLDLSKYNKPAEEVREGLYKGTLEIYPKGWTHIHFWCDKEQLIVEIKDIKTYPNHKTFAISLGKITKV